MIAGIFLTVVFMTLLTTLVLALIYNFKSQQGSFVYMSNDIMENLQLTSILGIILPPIIAIELVAATIAFGVGLFSSRAVAVPLYKIEKWAARIKTGKLNTTLAFREEKLMKDLTLECNAVTDFYRSIFLDIKEHVEMISHKPNDTPVVVLHTQRIKELLDKIEM